MTIITRKQYLKNYWLKNKDRIKAPGRPPIETRMMQINQKLDHIISLLEKQKPLTDREIMEGLAD